MTAPLGQVDAIVIGAGVAGLAVARELGEAGIETLVLEANDRIGEETSARNNEVIHAGFLYSPGTLKAALCLAGRTLLYDYCEARGISHRRVGKLMPAVTASEVAQLEQLQAQGLSLGVGDLKLLDSVEVRALEPTLRCHAALWSPSTGIVDSHGLMLALQADAERYGSQVVTRSRALSATTVDSGGFLVEMTSGDTDRLQVECRILVNAAGLDAERFARTMSGVPLAVPRVHLAKGCFYSYSGRAPFSHLIVPLGATLSEGGAFTLDLAGDGRFGPDLEWVDTRDYSVAGDRNTQFARAIGRYLPNFDAERLQPGYSGIRPRLTGPGEPPSDWLVAGPSAHGVQGLVHLLGIDTPGITACLAIAREVCAELFIRNERCVA